MSKKENLIASIKSLSEKSGIKAPDFEGKTIKVLEKMLKSLKAIEDVYIPGAKEVIVEVKRFEYVVCENKSVLMNRSILCGGAVVTPHSDAIKRLLDKEVIYEREIKA